MEMKLWILSLALAVGVGGLEIVGFTQPAKYSAWLKAFPRSLAWGYFLVILATIWFNWNLHNESIADFEPLKPYLHILFAAVGIGTCVYVKDFIAVRGAAVVMLLLANLMVDSARWLDTPWRLVIVIWAYLFVVVGIWFTISPWRMRDLIEWRTASLQRVRALSAIRLVFALFLAGLALFVFKPAERKSAALKTASSQTAGVQQHRPSLVFASVSANR
jgi:hypothetical protein